MGYKLKSQGTIVMSKRKKFVKKMEEILSPIWHGTCIRNMEGSKSHILYTYKFLWIQITWITRLDFMLIRNFAYFLYCVYLLWKYFRPIPIKICSNIFCTCLSTTTNLMEFLLYMTSSIYIFNWSDAIHMFRNCFKCYLWMTFKLVLSKLYSNFHELSIDSHFIISQRHITHISMSLFINYNRFWLSICTIHNEDPTISLLFCFHMFNELSKSLWN